MKHGKCYVNDITLAGPACKPQPPPSPALQKAQSITGQASIQREFSGALLKDAPNPHTKLELQMLAIMRLLLPVLGMAYAGSGMGHELEYAGRNLLSSRRLLFKSLHKVKWFMDFLAEGQ